MHLNGWRKARWQTTCLCLACWPGLGPAADLPSYSCKNVGQEHVPTVRDPAALLRGNLCRGTCGVRRRTRLRARRGATLEQPRRVRSRSGCVLRHSHHPASTTPQARPQGVGAGTTRAVAALGRNWRALQAAPGYWLVASGRAHVLWFPLIPCRAARSPAQGHGIGGVFFGSFLVRSRKDLACRGETRAAHQAKACRLKRPLII